MPLDNKDKYHLESVSTLIIYYQNVRGLRTKVQSFYDEVCASDFDFLCLTETWLSADVGDAELFPMLYNVVRCDRAFAACDLTRGGGVLLAAKVRYQLIPLNVSSIRSVLPMIDFTCCKVKLTNNINICLCVIYIPPHCPVADFELFFEMLEDFLIVLNDVDKSFLIGDFNVHFTNESDNDRRLIIINNFMEFFNFTQFNNIPNNHGFILDLVFSDLVCGVSKFDEAFVPVDAHHPCLVINLSYAHNHYKEFIPDFIPRTYNFSKADFATMYKIFSEIDWSLLYNCSDVDDACNIFYDLIYSTFDYTVPYTVCKHDKGYPIWFTRSIISKIKLKNKAHKKFKLSKQSADYEYYKALRSQVKTMIRFAYENYISKIEGNLVSDPKTFWNYIRGKKSHTRIPGQMTYNDSQLDNADAIVNAFAHFFQSVYIESNSNSCNKPCDKQSGESFPNIAVHCFSLSDVRLALKQVKNKKTAGLDLVPAYIVKDCYNIFCEPLLHIYNLILKTSTFPSIWKKVKVCPVFKSGDHTNIVNYRPIAILSNFSKVFESILYKHLYAQVKNLISPCQHGFMKKRSTETNLAVLSQYVAEALNQRGQVDVLYTDFRKAFDTINFLILIKKLDHFGFSGGLCNLFLSYLSEREQVVVYQQSRSLPFFATSGVPQGSNLGPLLFLLFINDLSDIMDSNRLFYADDLKLYAKIDCFSDCLNLQHDLDKVYNWCCENCLFLNIGKCKVISYSRKRQITQFDYSINNDLIQRCSKTTDLGVTFDTEFTFREHITIKIKESCRVLGFIYRNCSDFRNRNDSLKTLYYALVRSKLEYCSLIWYPVYSYMVKGIERIQRKFLKFLYRQRFGYYPHRHFEHSILLSIFGVLSLETRRVLSSINFVYKLNNFYIDCPLLLDYLNFYVPRLSSRSSRTFYCTFNRSNALKRSPITVACSNFNIFAKDCDLNFDSLKCILGKAVLEFSKK